MAIDFLEAGKDVRLEKPLAHGQLDPLLAGGAFADVSVDGICSLGKTQAGSYRHGTNRSTASGSDCDHDRHLKLLGAAGLLLPATAAAAGVCLAVLLIAMFPANARAAREHLKIGEAEATALPLRAVSANRLYRRTGCSSVSWCLSPLSSANPERTHKAAIVATS
jgi:hypothetical protein